jgi:hypothetical protein
LRFANSQYLRATEPSNALKLTKMRKTLYDVGGELEKLRKEVAELRARLEGKSN